MVRSTAFIAGGTTSFWGEKATNWEGRFRVPMVMRWSGVITPNTVRLLPWVECREECDALRTTFSRPPADLRSGFENSF
jgi:hypothetical protein